MPQYVTICPDCRERGQRVPLIATPDELPTVDVLPQDMAPVMTIDVSGCTFSCPVCKSQWSRRVVVERIAPRCEPEGPCGAVGG